MPYTNGVQHQTTVQVVQHRQPTYSTAPSAGIKRARPHSDVSTEDTSHSVKKTTTILPASALSGELPRLAASIIDVVEAPETVQRSVQPQLNDLATTPSSTVDPLLSLSHRVYGLPHQLVTNLNSLGIKSIYPWQKQCLLGPGLLRGEKNLVYTAPTGGGKSLVADVLMLKNVLRDREAKALLVLPYVALVQEKVRWLRNVVQGISRQALGQKQEDASKFWASRPDRDTVRVVGFFGGSKVKPTWADFDIGVCTIEKANALVNAAIDDYSISKLKVVVLDELHMIDDDHRGYLLELMGSKLLCLDHKVQIIGMSATLTNITLLKEWLQSHTYETRYRPVPIEEHLVCDGKVYQARSIDRAPSMATQSRPPSLSTQTQTQARPLRTIRSSDHRELQDLVVNAVVALAHETAVSGYGVLVFASSRLGCERDAELIAKVMPSFHEADAVAQEKRADLIGDLRNLSTGLDTILEQTIPRGVVFHHAGLTTEERDLVASAYDSGVIKVCVATCSLAAGINLPARRVILHNVRMGRDLVGPAMLRQMRGRAGRKGKDEIGETYLCCRASDMEDVVELMHADLPQISSCLGSDKRRIQRALLEAIAIRLATSRESLDDYIQKTMLYHTSGVDAIRSTIEESIHYLESMNFISTDQFGSFNPTQLGKAIVASALDPEYGSFIHSELKRALQAFVMDGELHVLYNFTPVQDLSIDIDWRILWAEMEKLDDSGLRVMDFLGLKPTVIEKMSRGGTLKQGTPEEQDTARRYSRFYRALQLRDLCNEVPIHRVAKAYKIDRGAVQTLAQTCEGFAAGMIKFCEQMGWGAMAAALDHFSDRLKAGARADLLALAKITFIKSRTARVFWDNGFKTVAAVANADPTELVPILLQAQPNKIRLGAKDEDMFQEKLLAKARIIADSANRLWQIEMQQELEEE